MGNKPVFNSVFILTFTMLFVKVLSAIYRVPYQNILGDTGLYAYQQVYPLIAIVSVLSLNAIPSVVSQSQYDTLFMKQLRKKVRKQKLARNERQVYTLSGHVAEPLPLDIHAKWKHHIQVPRLVDPNRAQECLK